MVNAAKSMVAGSHLTTRTPVIMARIPVTASNALIIGFRASERLEEFGFQTLGKFVVFFFSDTDHSIDSFVIFQI